VFLGAALATAGILYAIVATDGPNPLVPPRRDDRLATLGLFAFVVAGGIAVPGVILTFFYLRRRYGWIRGSYRVLLFLTAVANVLVFTTDARVLGPAIVPTSLFIALAPTASTFLTRYPEWQQTKQRLHRRAVLLGDGTVQSLFRTPVHSATFPRVTLWLAAVPWVSWLTGTLMLDGGRTLGGQMSTVITGAYVAAFYATLIGTPVLGYLAVRYLRAMSRVTKAWTLAGLLAGVKSCKDAYDAYSIFL
jgi:hypothetical protein